MPGSDDFVVLYAPSAPADGIRLGQLLVDETAVALKICTSLSPVTYTAIPNVAGNETITGTWTFTQLVTLDGGAQFNDNDKAFFGTGDDLQIYHDGTNNYIDSVNGTLILRAMAAGSHLHIHGNDAVPWFDFHAAAGTEVVVGDGTNSTSVRVTLDGPAATNRELRFETNGSLRWDIRAENTSESGSNAGSLLEILARQDDGTASYTLLSATRATAQVALVGGVGTTTNPNWGFVGDLNTGVMRPAADEISLVAGGTETVAVTATDVTVTGDLTVTGAISAASTDGEQAKVLASAVTITSDTVFDDIGGLVFSSLATGQYIFEAYLDLDVSSVPDMKRRFHFTGTAADVLITSQTQGPAAATTLLTAFDTQQDLTTTGQFGCNYTGKFTITATGSLSFQAAQITSSATAITVNKGCWMRIRRLG